MKTTASKNNRSASAERVRRHRAKRKSGKTRVCFEVEAGYVPACFQVKPDEIPVSFGINANAVERLCTLGWLREVDRADQQAVTRAFLAMGIHALGQALHMERSPYLERP